MSLFCYRSVVQKSDTCIIGLVDTIDGRRRRGRQRMRWLGGIIDAMNMNLGKLRDGEGQGSLVCCSPWGHEE